MPRENKPTVQAQQPPGPNRPTDTVRPNVQATPSPDEGLAEADPSKANPPVSTRPTAASTPSPDAGVVPVVLSQTPKGAGAPQRERRSFDNSLFNFRCSSVAPATGGNPQEIRLVRQNPDDPNIEIRIINFEGQGLDLFQVGKLYSIDLDEAEEEPK